MSRRDLVKTIPYFMLESLHHIGLVSIPNYYEYEWMNKFHKHFFIPIVWMCIIITLTLQCVGTFANAINDLSEFMLRLFESVAAILFIGEVYQYHLRLKQVLGLNNLMNKTFMRTNEKQYKRCERKILRDITLTAVTCVCTGIAMIMETFIPLPENSLKLMTKLYHWKHPERKFPFKMWLPFVDMTELKVYMFVYFYQVLVVIILMTCILYILAAQIMYSIPLLGQYEMLAEFIEKIGSEHMDCMTGENIYYTDINRSRYITDDQFFKIYRQRNYNIHLVPKERNLGKREEISVQNLIIEFKKWQKKVYERYYLGLIVKRHHELNHFAYKYMDLLKSVKNATTVIPTMITFILSFYQMAYLKHLPSIILRVKIVLEFFFLVLAVAHFTTQSEKMNSCQITLCRALCQNKCRHKQVNKKEEDEEEVEEEKVKKEKKKERILKDVYTRI
ncbi:hypothetical protein M8J77_018005 [Diaphorina citri]|nr:hypothetical protein M8J77_018005 [Diaphorina citri]